MPDTMSSSARLIVLTGPLKSTERPLPEGGLVIGRDLSSDLCIKDKALSRHQCRVTFEGGAYVVEDMGSRNGTTVNDRPVRRHALEDGDRIQIGGSLLLFVEGAWPRQTEAWLDDETRITKTSAHVSLEGAIYALARDLGVLLKIGAELNAIHSPVVLYQKLLESVFALMPADRGAILLTVRGSKEVETIFALDRSSSGSGMKISRTVVGQVLREGKSLVSNDVLEGGTLHGAASLVGSSVRALMCAPLSLLGKVVGLVYVDTRDPGVEFSEGHLNTLTALAGFAAGMIEASRRLDRLETENRRLLSDLGLEHRLVGEGARLREVLRLIAKVAPAESNVLIRGESGTGKELAARAVHRNSPRAEGPFVAINCATLTEGLLESELFGHERGAFTGAVAQKKGKIETANGGTLFLDEVGELSPVVQAKLLRVLQEREFERLGGTRPVKVDVRVVAATNRDLKAAADGVTFRPDLYHRLNVISLVMPPLRERREDIPPLVEHFIAKYGPRCKRAVAGVSEAALEMLVNYDWPGNVRELENAVERAVVLGSTELIMPEDLPEQVLEAAPEGSVSPLSFAAQLKGAKQAIVSNALRQAQGNYARAAKTLGIHPNNLHRLARVLGLKHGGQP